MCKNYSIPGFCLLTLIAVCLASGCQGPADLENDPRMETWVQALSAAEQAEGQGDAAATEGYLLEAVEIAEQIAADVSAQPLMETHYYLGRHYHAVGRPPDAAAAFHKVIELHEGSDLMDQFQLAEVQMRLGWVQNELGQLDSATELLSAARPVFEQPESDPQMLISTLAGLAAAQLSSGRHEGALDTLQQLAGEHLQQESPDTEAVARVLCSVCEVGHELGRPEEAETAIIEAAKLAEQGVLAEETTQFVHQVGLQYAQNVNNEQAIAYFQDQLSPPEPEMQMQQPMQVAQQSQHGGMSEAKQIAYEDMLDAQREYERLQRRVRADQARYRAQSEWAHQKVGNLAAMGVSEMYFMPEAPDQYQQMDMMEAEQEYQAARARFERTQ